MITYLIVILCNRDLVKTMTVVGEKCKEISQSLGQPHFLGCKFRKNNHSPLPFREGGKTSRQQLIILPSAVIYNICTDFASALVVTMCTH